MLIIVRMHSYLLVTWHWTLGFISSFQFYSLLLSRDCRWKPEVYQLWGNVQCRCCHVEVMFSTKCLLNFWYTLVLFPRRERWTLKPAVFSFKPLEVTLSGLVIGYITVLCHKYCVGFTLQCKIQHSCSSKQPGSKQIKTWGNGYL